MGKEIAMSETKNKYLVKLIPLGKFFFGGDMTFQSDSLKGNEVTNYASYIIHSFKMPQQTSLLGMLRFLLLSNNDQLFDSKENHIKKGVVNEVMAWIGEKSFNVKSDHIEANFGKIDRLGPCFLYNQKECKAYFKEGYDADLDVDFSKSICANINQVKMEIPQIRMRKNKSPNYSGKEQLGTYYITPDGTDRKKEEDLFKKDSRIGIDKDYEGKVKNAAFYKQISYRLERDFCFAFEVEAKADLTVYSGTFVKLGADDSNFLFKAELSDGQCGFLPHEADSLRVVLLSDSYLPLFVEKEKKTMEYVRYAITRVRPFRFLSSSNSIEARDYNVKYKSLRSFERYDLYESGSVFYFDNSTKMDEFCKALDSCKEFVQVGYNKYCKIKQK